MIFPLDVHFNRENREWNAFYPATSFSSFLCGKISFISCQQQQENFKKKAAVKLHNSMRMIPKMHFSGWDEIHFYESFCYFHLKWNEISGTGNWYPFIAVSEKWNFNGELFEAGAVSE